MNHSSRLAIRLATIGLFSLIALSTFSQEYYVKTETLSDATGNEGKSYHYTQSITLTDGFVANGTNGSFTITPIPVNIPPSLTENFVRVEVPKVPVASERDLTLLSADDKSVSYSYSDGLGRTTMSTAAAAGPNYTDMVQYHHYDGTTGRQDQSYLPYAKNYPAPGSFQSNAKDQTVSFYNTTSSVPEGRDTDTKPFSYTEFDARGRVSAVVAPGANWHTSSTTTAKKTTYDYFIHNPTEANASIDFPVAKWKIVNDQPVTSENYGAKELSITVVTDPQGRKMRTVKDMRGLTITSQSFDPTTQKWYGSYNVYDEMGRVRFVIPPILCTGIGISTYIPDPTPTQIEELVFQYKYDAKGRIALKKAPGAGWEYFVYDEWDRLVMTRHEGQQYDGGNSWTFYKYDVWNRQIISGEVKTDDSRYQVITKLAGKQRYEIENTDFTGYSTNSSFPRLPSDYSVFEIRTINYYDDYSFKTNTNWAENLSASAFNRSLPSGFTGAQLSNALNRPTGSKVRILGATGSNQWLNTVMYYDDEGRVQQTIAENHLGGTDRLTNQLDWKGELEKMLLEHTSATDAVDVLSEYEYSHNGQLLKSFQTIDGGTRVEVGDYHYNVLGELVEKNLHSTNGVSYLQSVDYRYNIQSALKAINDPDLSAGGDSDLFGMKYHYETNIGLANTEDRYDGMVNTMEYNATNVTSSVNPGTGPNGSTKTALGFDYDERNRLKGTSFAQATGSTYDANGEYNMTSSYDDNGNIKNLTRKSAGIPIDDLTYTYEASSNKLTQVTDTETTAGFDNTNGGVIDYPGEYGYDIMGNMISDAHKEIYLSYNHLQLVDKITFEQGTGNVQTTIEYTYDAVGNRLSKSIIDGDNNVIAKVDYVGLVEYLDDEINQLFTDEGRAYKQNDQYHYEYFITDHQGNNRVAFGNLPERNIYVATMESEMGNNTSNDRSDYEESEFAFPANIRSTLHNHTPLGEESVALNGSLNGKEVGPAKVLTISGGDEVDLEVWAKYTDGGWNNSSISDIVSVISSTFGGASAGTGAESASTSLNNALSAGSPGVYSGNTSGQPEAYLQYLFFDNNYNYVSSRSGFIAVSSAANGKFAKLEAPTIEFGPNESGYLFVYVVNESNQNKNVFFDDFKITHASSTSAFRVTQVNDYYPYGLPTSNSWRAPGYIDPGLLYQSSYASLDSLTGYYDFLSRSYDPVLGRFFAVDPAGQFASPYAGMGNMPHWGTDPNGEIFGFIAGALLATAGQAGVQSLNGNGSFWSNVQNNGFVIGGGFSQNESYIGAGPASLGMVSRHNFPNQGSPIFGGFARPDAPLDYGLPGPYQGGDLIAGAFALDPMRGSGDYNFLGALKQRNTFYPTIPLGGDGNGLAGGGQARPVCSICDHNNWKWSSERARRNYTSAFIAAAGHSLLLSSEFRAASRGRFTHFNGNTYKNRFYGNQHSSTSKWSVRASKLNTATTARFVSGVSTTLIVAGVFSTIYDGTTNGWQNHHTADLVLTGGFYALSASVPVAGWIVGGSYFLADITTQYYTGRSITQHIFD